MAKNRLAVAAGTYDIGAGSDGNASLLIIGVANLTGSVAVTGRVVGSGQARTALSVKKRSDDSALASIVAAGVYEVNTAGLDTAYVITGGPADIAIQLVAG